MIRGVIKTSLSFRFLVIIIAGILLVVGVSQARQMPVDVLPEFSPPYVEIQTEALGLSAEEVKSMITVPMEQDLIAGVAWADSVHSESLPGLSSILISFKPGTNLYQARQLVAERLAQSAVGLPHVSKPPTMIQPLSSASRFMLVGLSSKKLSLIDLSVLARWTIAPRLMGVPGVAHVAIWGQRERQLQVQVDPEKLLASDVGLDQIIQTTGNALWVSPLTYLEASSPGTGGFIDTPNQRLNVWHVLPIASAEDLAKVPVEGADGQLLGDVADVVEDHQPLIGDAIVNNSPNLLLVIEKLPGTNTLEVTHGVEKAINAMRPGFTGVDFNPALFRPATYIEMALSNLAQALVIAAILLVIALGVLLYSWRTALVSLVAILVSLAAALAVLFWRGETLNTMILAGLVIALGIVIDEALVDAETVMRRLRQNQAEEKPQPAGQVIMEALSETRGAVIFGVLITLLAILPVFLLDGTTGALLEPLAASYALAVIAALVIALAVTPGLAVILLSGSRVTDRETPVLAWLKPGYDRVLAKLVKQPLAVYAGMAFLVVAGVVSVFFIHVERFLPTFREPYVMINLQSAPSTSRLEMDRIVARISAEVQSIPGVKNVGAHVGRAVFGDQIVDVNSAQIWVNVDPKANYNAAAAAIQDTIDGYAGLFPSVSTYLDQTVQQTQSGQKTPLTVRVYGEDQAVLRTQAEKLRQSLTGIQGVSEARVDLPVEQPTMEIEADLNVAQRYGIKPGDVRRTAAVLLSGLSVGSLFEEQKVFDVVVWGAPDKRTTLADIGSLPIAVPGGGYVHLSDVAAVRLVAAPTVIHRQGISSYLDINLNVAGRDSRAVIGDVENVIHSAAFPMEYHAEVISDAAAQQAALQRILITGILALAGIFLLLQAAFRNWRLALASFLTVPLMLVGGGIVAALFSSGSFPAISLLGLLTVLGIGLRNSILLVNEYQRLEPNTKKSISMDLVRHGARERLAPILMTLLTVGVVLLPFVIPGSLPGFEIARPLAAIILGGLVTSGLYNLFAVPILYLKLGASREADLGFQPVRRKSSRRSKETAAQ